MASQDYKALGTKLELDDVPRVRHVIAIAKELIREDRLHNRIRRALIRAWYFDWTAWIFRRRMQLARVRGQECTKILSKELWRISRIVVELNAGVPREYHVRGKVWLPAGVFKIRPLASPPENVDIIYPKAKAAE